MSRITLLAILGFAALANAAVFRATDRDFDDLWEEWKGVHKKTYKDDADEMERRMVWQSNRKVVVKHNLEQSLGHHSFSLGINKYSDLRIDEIRETMNGYKSSNKTRSSGITFLAPSNIQLPDTVDWRKEGYVTPVKDQGQCGSCWSFSTTGSLEGQSFKKTGKLPDLSEQNLVDCSKSYGNNGCEGGLMDYAFEYIKANGGIDSEECYPYEAVDSTCRYKTSCDTAEDTGYVDVPSGDEDALKKAVATVGPISVAIDASHMSFQMYKDGVYDEPDCSSSQLDHGVLVVGYGTDNGQDYWLVKNSWGESWGQNGYIMMSRNKDNQCGIASSASYPTV